MDKVDLPLGGPRVESCTGLIDHVLIIGGGTAGWMTAAALAKYTSGTGCRITLVESPDIGTVGVGEATIPPIRKYHSSLAIDESELIREAGATIKLGIEFKDWHHLGNSYVHPFGLLGRALNGVGFHQLFLRLATNNLADEISQYSPCAVAGHSGRFAPGGELPDSPDDGFPFAFHLDAKLYAQLLRRYAERLGVFRVEGTVLNCTRRFRDGFIDAVTTADGRVITAELFIDCSGSRAILIEKALGVKYLDWSGVLPCNRALVAPSRTLKPPPLFTRSSAKAAGWQWRIQLQHRVGNGYVYSAAHSSDEAAEDMLRASLGPSILEPPRLLSFTTGRREIFWDRNVVAIGLSAGFLEPLESTSIHLIQVGIAKLLELFPDVACDSLLSDKYNQIMASTFDSIRDFIILHYTASARNDSPFWRDVRDMSIPDSLRATITLFRDTGRFIRDENELFSRESWAAVMLGQGIIPRKYNPLADSIHPATLASHAANVQKQIQATVAKMPLHEDYLKSCASNGT